MEKKRVLLSIITLSAAVSFALSSCANEASDVITSDASNSIFVISDTHLLSNNLISPKNKLYRKEAMTNDGRVQEMDYELMENFVSIVNQRKPKAIMITGDLTFYGEKDSHLEMARILSKINEHTKALVIPGNHDTYMSFPRSFLNDAPELTTGIGYSDFREIYANNGYMGALSYDEESLSYVYEIDDSTWALMLDSTLNRFNQQESRDLKGGYLHAGTMEWMKQNLELAKSQNKRVISFMHHNLITHSKVFETDYTLNKAKEVRSLLRKYNVTLNFSGHLHIQNIQELGGIYDIATESLLDYGNQYGELKLGSTGIDYQTYSVISSKQKEHTKEVFINKYKSHSLARYKQQYGEQGEELCNLVAKANADYFNGDYELIPAYKEETVYQDFSETMSVYEKSIFDVEPICQRALIVQ